MTSQFRLMQIQRDMYTMGTVERDLSGPITREFAERLMEGYAEWERANCSRALPVVSVSGETCSDAFYSKNGDSYIMFRIDPA